MSIGVGLGRYALWFACRRVATSCVGRFILTVMDGLGKMDRTSAKEEMHFHDKTRVGVFVFVFVFRRGRRKFCFLFAIPTALQRLSESTCTFLSSVLLRFGRCPSFAVCPFGKTNTKMKSMEHWCLETNLPQRHVVHLKSHMDWPEIEPGP